MKIPSIEGLLAATPFQTDEEHAHIVIDPEACRRCPSDRACTYCCPAERFVWDDERGTVAFDHVGCLECGTCRLVCDRLRTGADGYSWNYPVDGSGVSYRQG